MTVLEHLALFVAHFLPWTLLIYWVHRLVHMVHIPIITAMHWDHHRFITRNGKSLPVENARLRGSAIEFTAGGVRYQGSVDGERKLWDTCASFVGVFS